MEKHFWIYILTNKSNKVLYIGVTSNLAGRVYQHKTNVVRGFTSKYNVKKLVYYEQFSQPLAAIEREKHLKQWMRQWKIDLITKANPGWKDLFFDIAH